MAGVFPKVPVVSSCGTLFGSFVSTVSEFSVSRETRQLAGMTFFRLWKQARKDGGSERGRVY